jgi:hypothetical protein
MKTPLSNVSCKYGAPMGRSDFIPDDIETAGKLYLEKLRWVDGAYDQGGAYWGMGDPIYRASGETATECLEIFVRAKDREDAKKQIKEIFEGATFHK